MTNELHLILHNFVGIAAVLVSLYVIIILFLNDRRKTVNLTLILTFVGVIVFIVSHLLGVSAAGPERSRQILMWNLSVIFISMFNVHCVLAALKRERETRWFIAFVYAAGLFLTAFYLWQPDTFLLPSIPKMYFPNYYVPGQFYWVSRAIFQLIIPIYFIYELIRAYRRTPDPVERNRVVYFAVALFLGWGLGAIPPLLIFNISVDPLYGLFFPIAFAIPFTYAILRYELLDIRIIAKKAFLYTAAVLGIGGLITVFNTSNQWLSELYPGFPFWIAPLISATIVVIGALLIWRQLRESDVMKYEFITVVTHKFRTPLTHIRWAAENLAELALPPSAKEQINQIQNANVKLVELTNILVNASEAEIGDYGYQLESLDFSQMVRETISSLRPALAAKKIRLVENLSEVVYVSGDRLRLRFVVQTILDNAVNYTPESGMIRVSLARRGEQAVCTVTDNGIGLSPGEAALAFAKFYRSAAAKLMDTEGVGIGLFISKKIMAHHRGEIWLQSPGLGKGATAWLSLPVAK